MALIKCKECGHEVSKKADKCPNCGAPIKKQTSGCAMLFAIISGVVFVTYIATLSDSSTSSSSGSQGSSSTSHKVPVDIPDVIEAWTVAQDFVKDRLKSPTTADFGSVFKEYQDPRKQVTPLVDNTFKVVGGVDSQNAFGATIRTRFSLKIKYMGNMNWRLVEDPILIQR